MKNLLSFFALLVVLVGLPTHVLAQESISGTITASADGAPILGVTVCAESEAEPDFQTSVCADTDVNGDYVINSVPALDDIIVWTNANGQPFVDEVYDDRRFVDFSQGDRIDLTAGSATGINFDLNPAAAVSGRVTSTADGLGISGVTVCAESEAEPDFETSVCTDTDANGDYMINGVPALDDIIVRTNVNGQPFIDEIYNDRRFVDFSQGDRVDLTGGDVAGIDFALDAAAAVSGRVTSTADGLGISGVTVCAESEAEPDYQTSACADTDANGDYMINGVPALSDIIVWTNVNGQNFSDEVFNDRKDFDFSQGDQIDLTVGDATGIDFGLDVAGFLSGEIQDEFGNPLNDFGNVQIFVADSAGNVVWQGNNGDSTWTSQTLIAGDYFAYAQGENFGVTSEVWNDVPCPNLTCDITAVGTPITITGGEVSGIDFTLAPVQEFTLTGSIQDASGNGIGGKIALRKPNGGFVADIWVNGDGTQTTSFAIPAGQYVAFAGEAPGFEFELWTGGEPNLACPNLGCDLGLAALIDLSAGNATGIDFVLEPIIGGGTLSGNIVEAADGVTPVEFTSVSVVNAAGEFITGVSTDLAGNFTTQQLSDGDVYLRLETDAPRGLAPEIWNGGEPLNTICVPFDLCFDPSNGAPITIAGGDVTGLDFQLEVPAGGQVFGTFEDLEFNFPLAELNVELLDSDGNYVNNLQTDRTGSYFFSGLADGDYKVFVSGPSEGYPQFLIGDGSCTIGCDRFGSGTLFTVSGGNAVNVGLQQIPYEGGPRITGTVTRSDNGAPVASRLAFVDVAAFDPGGIFGESAGTDISGRFQIVPPGGAGDYALVTNNDQAFFNLINEVYENVSCINCDPNDPARTLVNVPDTGTQTAIADFALDPGRTISGTVTSTSDGSPIQGITVCVEPEPEPDGAAAQCEDTDSNGNYAIFGLPARDDYVASTFNNGLQFLDEVYDDLKDVPLSSGALIDVSAGNVSGIDFGLDVAGFLSGEIQDEFGNPLNDFGNVQIFVADSAGNVVWQGNNGDSTWTSQTLIAGDYFAYAQGENFGVTSEVWNDVPCPNLTCDITAVGTPITITGGEVSGIDFTLSPIQEFTISGSIRDAAGNPIGGELIVLNAATGNSVVGVFVDGDGNGTSQPIPAGEYIILAGRRFSQPGFVEELWNDGEPFNLPCPVLGCDLFAGTSVDLTAGDVTGIDFVLDPIGSGGRISGTVVDDLGAPVPSVSLSVLNAGGYPVQDLSTDANGAFETPLLPDGDVFLRVENNAPGGLAGELWNGGEPNNTACIPFDICFDLANGQPITIAGADVPNRDFQLEIPAGGRIVGVVQDADFGFPLADQGVTLFDPFGGFVVGTQTAGDGSFVFAGLADDDYKVYVDGPSEGYEPTLFGLGGCNGCDLSANGTVVTVSGGAITDIGTLSSEYVGGPRLTGFLTRSDTGAPLLNNSNTFAGVNVYDAGGGFIQGLGTDRGGRYQVELAPGDYQVHTFNDQGLIDEVFDNIQCAGGCGPNDPSATLVTVPGTGAVTGLADFALDPGRTISGTVTATADGLPIANITVCTEPETVPDYSVSRCENTDANGNYTISGLIAGNDYIVWTQNNGLPFIDEVFDDRKDFDFSQGDLIDVSSGDAGGIDFALDDTASIRGTITASADGLPIEGLDVDLFDASCNFVTRVRTDAAGQYVASIFGDGEYYVYAGSNSLGFIPELFPDLQRLSLCFPDPVTDGTAVSISGSQIVTGIDFELDVGASISGFVSDSSGVLPQFGAQARLYATDGTQLLGSFNGQPDNSYLLQGLPAGDYNVVLSGGLGTSGLIDERWDDVPCPRNSCPSGLGDVITLAPGEVRTGIDAVLGPGSVISGQVTDQQGNPLTSTGIAIYNDLGIYAAFAVTDANGNYTTRNGLPAGNYLVSNQSIINSPTPVDAGFIPTVFPDRACGDPCDFLIGDPVTVDGVNPTTGIDLVVQSTRTISGTVRAEDTLAPVADANVCLGVLSEAANGFQQCQLTDAQGQFAFSDLGALPDFIVGVDSFSGQGFFPELFDNADCCDLTQGTPIDTFGGDSGITIDVARSATISGTVLDSGSLLPLAGIPVDLIDASCNLVASAGTDEFGNYTITGFGDGTYYVHALGRFSNYVGELFPNIKRVDPCFPDPITDGAPFVVTGTQAIGNIDFELDRGAVITGFVSDANGLLPQFGGQARLYALDGTQLFVQFNSEPDNAYRLQGLLPGDYNVVLSGSGLGLGLIDEIFEDIPCPRNSCPPGTGATISLAPGEVRTGISATLDVGSQISGRLTDGSGNPLPNTLIAVYDAVGEYAGFAQSDENGEYTTPMGFPAGDYLVSNQFAINQPTPVAGGFLPVVWPDVACGEPCDFLLGDPIALDGVNPVNGIDLVFQTGSSIAGTVTGNAAPVAGVELRLLNSSDGSLIRTAFSGSDGSYLFDGIGAGDYLLRTSNGLGLDDQLYLGISCNPFCDPLSGTPVGVPPDTDVTGIDFALTSTPQIVGTVTDDTGVPAGGVRVEAYNSLGALIASTSSAADGSFEIGNLFAGTFYVRTRNTLGLIDALADGLFCVPGCNPVLEGTPIGVGSSGNFPAGGLSMQLGDASGLFGRVTGSGADLSAVAVEVYTPNGTLAARQTTDDLGNYTIDGLSAGTYHVVTRNGQGFIDEGATGQACPSSCAPTTTTPISIAISEQQQLDFALLPGAVISGQVSDPLGASLPSVEVTVFTDAGVEVASAITDASGNYSVRALLPADYVVATTSNPYGLRNRLFDDLPCDAGCNVLGGTLITLTSGGQATGIDFVLPDGKSISGVLTRSSGNPLGGVRVAAFDGAGTEVASAQSGPSGAFTITGLPDGVYQLRTFNTIGFIDQAIGGDECTPVDCDLALATSFDVTAASQTGADAVLRSGQNLTGVATDENNNPIFSGEAQLYSEQAELLKTTPISNGSFTFNGLAAGTYYAVVTNDLGLVDQAWTGPGVPSLDCPGGSCLTCLTTSTCLAPPDGPAPIELVEPPRRSVGGPRGGGSDLEFRLPPGDPIAGVVTNAQGAAIPGVRIYFFSADGASAGTATSDGLGQFRTDAAFSAGSWVAATKRVGQPGVIGFINELFDDIPCGTECDPLNGDVFSTPAPPSIDFQLDRVQTEQIFSSGFEF